MASVLDLLKPLAQPSMNGFDLSQKHVYSSAPGRFDAPMFVETMPRDKFKVDMSGLMRTMTLNTAAFLRGKVTYDFYFVPYSQIWHPFNQFISQRMDAHSTRQRGFKYVPVINLYHLFLLIGAIHTYYYDSTIGKYNEFPYYLKDVHGVPWIKNIFRMLDYFGYGNYSHLEYMIRYNMMQDYETDIELYRDKYVNIFRPAAYQHIWYDYYRNKFYDNYEWDTDVYGHVEDFVGFFNFDDIECDTFANSVIPIIPASLSANENLRIYGMFQQRYVQYKQDFLQSALPSQQFGAVSQVTIDVNGSAAVSGSATLDGTTGDDVGRWSMYEGSGNIPSGKNITSNSANFLNAQGEGSVRHTHVVNGSASITSYASISGNGYFDVISLKRAEALQKWRQNVMRAGNMVDDNFRAHFGATPRYESDNNVYKLKSYETSLSINVVEATAQSSESGNNRVGDLGATATALVNGGPFEYDCRDFGVIVCCQYFRPESEYSSVMIDRANTLYESFDFPTPEFCNIGLSPIELRDYNFNLQSPSTVLGFASQYWWYKTALDKCHGDFAKYQYSDLAQGGNVYIEKGSMVFWNAPRLLDMVMQRSGELFRSKSSLYVNPSILDDVFAIQYFNPSELVAKLVDSLIFNTYFDVKVIRPLTVVGLPNF